MNSRLFLALVAQVLIAAQAVGAEEPSLDVSAARRHWAYRLPETAALPQVDNTAWLANEVDAHVLARIEAAGLHPGPDADRATLARRLYFDLHGLPPTPHEIDRFLDDQDPDACARLVDRLLASPRFGERWGRHWLDVVRYAESLTLRGLILPEAWRFRDYVVASFNSDRPFDQLVRQHVAGDLLDGQRIPERQEQQIAATFLTLGNHNLEDQDKEQLRMDVVNEQLESIGSAFLAQTIGCARCHDHKFDPIPTRDYYALAGILRNTRMLEDDNVSKWIEMPLVVPPDEERVYVEHEQALAQLDAQIRTAKASTSADSPHPAQPHALQRILEKQRKQLLDVGPRRPMVMAVREEANITDSPIHRRGDVHSLGNVIPRGFLSVAVHGPVPALPPDESGRREIADWLASPMNPLTARVVVNRAWHWLFGAGLVRTVDNFGTTGENPSHPELLDGLALRFVQDQWSVKRLVRRLVLSRAYGLVSEHHDPAAVTVDPENRLWWRTQRRRLDVECLRDTMLDISGELDLRMGGPTIRPGTDTDYGYAHDQRYRSVYVPVLRNSLPELFTVFDFANPSYGTGQRSMSTVAPQALLMMNHPWIDERARSAANSVLRESKDDDRARITLAFRRTLGHPPTDAELALALEYVVSVRTTLAAGGELEAYTRMIHALFGSLDFRYLH
jgi:hypothetical protein